MKTAYLDCFSGLSGDMLAGALIDAGADFAELEAALKSLPLAGYRLATRRKTVNGIAALKFDVEVSEPQPERHLGEIAALIDQVDLTQRVRRSALEIFSVLADAEAKVHHTTREAVHFHEVGAVDSIIDIVAAAWGLDRLNVGTVLVSTLPAGSGFTRSRHGVIPVPAPATVELLAGFPLRINDGVAEMVTPTGAAILRALAHPAPPGLTFETERIGYGAGTMEFADRPNVLRLMLGQPWTALDADELAEIETNIDDLNPQIYDHVSERLFAAGARDVTITPIIMKKGRPGVTLSVLAEAGRIDALAKTLFTETSTIGLRTHRVSRLKLRRESREVKTRWGVIRVKFSGVADSVPTTVTPEYEDCRRAALENNVALRVVMEDALGAARAEAAHRHDRPRDEDEHNGGGGHHH